jgi:peptidoglycan/xylan/chitin deacetylase (PgdA/CDA1 family)
MRLFRPLLLFRLLYPGALFRVNTKEKELCLTFDDGPDPGSTPKILDILDSFGVKATFFCNGREAENNRGLIALISSKGHIIGNHGYRHLNGWVTNTLVYIRNVSRAAESTSSWLFRPPYGRIRPRQYLELVKDYRIVFWDLMPYDFDMNTGSGKVLRVLKKKIRTGSVIVLHDKSSSSVLSFLAEFLEYAGKEGYKFKALPVSDISLKRQA